MTTYTDTPARARGLALRLNLSLREIGVGALAAALTIVLFGAVYLQPGWPHSATGAPDVVDGSTLTIQGQSVSLIGLSRGDATQRTRLTSIAANAAVSCSWRGDHTNRARCRANGVDVTRLMLERGWAPFNGEALNSMSFDEYLRAEYTARQAKSGIWAPGARN